jgi:protein transport protein SEC24
MDGQKKKRAYAAQAGYEFGQNVPQAPMMGAPPAMGGLQDQFAGMNLQQPLQGYPQQPQQLQQPLQPQQHVQQQQQQQQHQAAPQPQAAGGYPNQNAVGGYAAQNQLLASDLSQQPFSVVELESPPPAIQLPPNSSVTPSPYANASPRYVRSTLNAVPTTHSLLKKSKLPFALVISPYATLHDSDDNVPVANDQCIARCRRCRSYINSFVTFLDHGHRWRCNMCNLSNDVPQAFDWDQISQQSVDRWQRPELNYSVVDFVAPQEYMVRAPQPLTYVFLLDVSYSSIANGLLATTARCILESLDRIPNADGRSRLAFIAVDSSLHYFTIPRDGTENNDAKQLVVSDLDEPFLPTPDDLVVNLRDTRANLEKFLDKLQSIFKDTTVQQCAMGSALRAGLRLIGSTGGKLTVITSSMPNVGFAKLEMRENKAALGTAKETQLLQTASSFYKSFAVDASKQQVSIDMFLFSAQYNDVASLSNLPRYTGGNTYFYPGWNAARAEDSVKWATELSAYLSAEIGLEAVLRIRATTGLRMNSFYGNFFNRSSDLCAFPGN